MQTVDKYSFHDDYSEGAHPTVLNALIESNLSQRSGYGDDRYSNDARDSIRRLLGTYEPDIYFTPGGTGANPLSIACFSRPHEAIIAAECGHIVGKEGGAVEATGHKIIAGTCVDGKLTPESIQLAFSRSSEFQYQPKAKMVFISNATEAGTINSKDELKAIAMTCKELKLFLLLDGARLGCALTSNRNDLTLTDVYNFTDVFWIGGTKNGALFGEAVVIKDHSFGADFPYHMKQRGALLAKGSIIAIQFLALLKDDLFFKLARLANNAATKISKFLLSMGFNLWAETEYNQVFVILPLSLAQELQKYFDFFIWEHLKDEHVVIRFVTSWATENSEVERLCQTITVLTNKS